MSSMMGVALRWLSARNYTEKELRSRLAKQFSDLPEVDEAIDAVCLRLHELNLLNDARYSEHRAAHQVHKGNRFISQDLKQKGVDSGIIAEVMAELPDEFIRALHEARKKQWNLQGKDREKAKAKLTRFLSARCFSYHAIHQVLEHLTREDFFV